MDTHNKIHSRIIQHAKNTWEVTVHKTFTIWIKNICWGEKKGSGFTFPPPILATFQQLQKRRAFLREEFAHSWSKERQLAMDWKLYREPTQNMLILCGTCSNGLWWSFHVSRCFTCRIKALPFVVQSLWHHNRQHFPGEELWWDTVSRWGLTTFAELPGVAIQKQRQVNTDTKKINANWPAFGRLKNTRSKICKG